VEAEVARRGDEEGLQQVTLGQGVDVPDRDSKEFRITSTFIS